MHRERSDAVMEDREVYLEVWYDDKEKPNDEELEKIKDKIRKIEGVSYVATHYCEDYGT